MNGLDSVVGVWSMCISTSISMSMNLDSFLIGNQSVKILFFLVLYVLIPLSFFFDLFSWFAMMMITIMLIMMTLGNHQIRVTLFVHEVNSFGKSVERYRYHCSLQHSIQLLPRCHDYQGTYPILSLSFPSHV